jgi:alpha-tubulin suppressor-like RCC1 family protein
VQGPVAGLRGLITVRRPHPSPTPGRAGCFIGLALGLLVSGGGCSAPRERPPGDAGLPADAPRGDTPIACGPGQPCPAGQFCGLASQLCVPAVVQVVTGAQHTCAAHADGRISCWGLGEAISASGAYVAPPRFLSEPRDPLTLAAGSQLTCAITADRRVRCWGNQAFTLLADGAPLDGVTGLALGRAFGCAANGQGVHCWGTNDLGQLARPPEVDASSQALLAQAGASRFLGAGLTVVSHDGADRLCAWGHNGTHLVTSSDAVNIYREPVCGSVPDVVELAVGADHACVRHAAGTFSCWGERYYGQLGLGGGPTDTEDVPPFGGATSLPGGGAVALAAGASHTCALLAGGSVTCFGRNHLGQVGPDPGTTEEEVRVPVAVGGLSGPVVGLASGATAQHTCAILKDGSVQCWGSNQSGQLGDFPPRLAEGRFSAAPVAVRW